MGEILGMKRILELMGDGALGLKHIYYVPFSSILRIRKLTPSVDKAGVLSILNDAF